MLEVSSDIQERIQQELDKIEQEENVQIVYACESGSRAWGFPSKDSDYDVRFIYVRPVDWYLSLDEGRDVIERPISDMLDINGWDLKKALKLFRKSNPPLMEWLQSDMVYRKKFTIADQIRRYAGVTFSPRASVYHYLHMARGNYRDYLRGKEVKIKKYFYVLRPILACNWIEEYGTMPKIQFQQLVEGLIPERSELMQEIRELLARKVRGDELDIEPRIGCIHEFIEERLAHYEQVASELPASSSAVSLQEEKSMNLDDLFRSSLREVWGQSH